MLIILIVNIISHYSYYSLLYFSMIEIFIFFFIVSFLLHLFDVSSIFFESILYLIILLIFIIFAFILIIFFASIFIFFSFFIACMLESIQFILHLILEAHRFLQLAFFYLIFYEIFLKYFLYLLITSDLKIINLINPFLFQLIVYHLKLHVTFQLYYYFLNEIQNVTIQKEYPIVHVLLFLNFKQINLQVFFSWVQVFNYS